MILQSLTELFERIQAEDDNPYGVPTFGYTVQNISFRIILKPDGSVIDMQDARETITETTKAGLTKTKQIPKSILLPDLGGRSRNTKSNFLYDKLSYLTGFDKDPDRAELAKEHFEAAKVRHFEWRETIPHQEYQAVCAFFEKFKKEDHLDKLNEITKLGANPVGVFRVIPSHKDVHELPEILNFWSNNGESIKGEGADKIDGQCLVTGRSASIARLHEPKLKGFGQDSPLLVSFEGDAYRSYDKSQSYNAPVSESAVFAYCNALNALLAGPQSHRHHVMIGDTNTLFWTEKKTSTESLFAKILNGGLSSEIETITSEDQTHHREIKALLTILRRGGGASLTALKDDPNTKFYILGLAKMNKSRVAVRFWHVSTIGKMLENLHDHYQNLALTRSIDPHPFWEPEFPSAQRIIEETARNRDRKAIAPLLGGQLMQSILHRGPYPHTLFQGILNRIKVVEKDQQGNIIERVPYLKAAILKAILIRNFNQTIDMSLNTERTEPAYLLGRLFAALEKTQEDALGKINAGIRERFYSSASATPGSVFPRILRTYQHHLAKLEGGIKTNRERLVQAIHAPLNAYPAYLTLEQQGMFAIGYYHQRQDFYTKKENTESKEPANV